MDVTQIHVPAQVCFQREISRSIHFCRATDKIPECSGLQRVQYDIGMVKIAVGTKSAKAHFDIMNRFRQLFIFSITMLQFEVYVEHGYAGDDRIFFSQGNRNHFCRVASVGLCLQVETAFHIPAFQSESLLQTLQIECRDAVQVKGGRGESAHAQVAVHIIFGEVKGNGIDPRIELFRIQVGYFDVNVRIEVRRRETCFFMGHISIAQGHGQMKIGFLSGRSDIFSL